MSTSNQSNQSKSSMHKNRPDNQGSENNLRGDNKEWEMEDDENEDDLRKEKKLAQQGGKQENQKNSANQSKHKSQLGNKK